MPVSLLNIKGYLKYILIATAILTASCSIRETLDECPPDPGPGPTPADIRQLLYLRATDGVTRNDITDTEELEDVMVYLFDRNEKLVDTIPYTQAMIRNGIPIDMTKRGLEGGYATVWANIGNAVETDEAEMGDDIDDLEIRMLPHDSRADFFLCPGDIHFGYKQMAFVPIDDVTEADTVWIQRKNARLHITVRGLPDNSNAADYYFRIGALYSAYNFEGEPQLQPLNIWEEGQFDANGDFVSPEPYQMIHNSPDHIYSPSSRVVVGIYKIGDTGADTLIASTDMDIHGQYISLARAKTTNVLIVLEEQTGEVTVRIAVTPWDEIHQWVIW